MAIPNHLLKHQVSGRAELLAFRRLTEQNQYTAVLLPTPGAQPHPGLAHSHSVGVGGLDIWDILLGEIVRPTDY